MRRLSSCLRRWVESRCWFGMMYIIGKPGLQGSRVYCCQHEWSQAKPCTALVQIRIADSFWQVSLPHSGSTCALGAESTRVTLPLRTGRQPGQRGCQLLPWLHVPEGLAGAEERTEGVPLLLHGRALGTCTVHVQRSHDAAGRQGHRQVGNRWLCGGGCCVVLQRRGEYHVKFTCEPLRMPLKDVGDVSR